ncbi:MAG: HNH endonuclease [Acidithiobacillus sp.]|jgi:5-methylcytosine-specific restriction endonuclease McrA|uniref:HNH endonuclease n=1 Tax=Acidithiobacillus sp. TaxID=1872118 RepID=UPI00355FBA5B
MQHVAVLNYDLTFNNLAHWKRVLVLIEKGKVEVLKYSDKFIKTSNKIIRIPFIVKLKNRIANLYKKGIRFSKENIYIRDQNKCVYCGKHLLKSEKTIDHVIPKSRDGKSNWNNCVCSCKTCNSLKGSKLISETNLILRMKPYTPTIARFVTLKIKLCGFEDYLNELYSELL